MSLVMLIGIRRFADGLLSLVFRWFQSALSPKGWEVIRLLFHVAKRPGGPVGRKNEENVNNDKRFQ